MPRDRAAVPALAEKLRRQGKKDLQWDQPQLFDAFEWPSPFPAILTDVVLRGSGLPSSIHASNGALHALANELVSELRKQSPGDRVAAAVRDTFPDGLTSYRIEMQAKLDKSYGAKASYDILYVFFGRTKARFCQLIVRGEAGLGGLYQQTAERIAVHFLPD